MSRNSVFLNPKFKNIHINPKFIQAQGELDVRATKIHINPNFIPKNEIKETSLKAVRKPPEKALVCTRNKLIRSVRPGRVADTSIRPLKKIGLRKLVREESVPRNPVQLSNPALPGCSYAVRPTLRDRVSKFKLVRQNHNTSDSRLKVFSKRNSFSEDLTPRKVTVSRYRLRRIGNSSKETPKEAAKKKLFNINGVLYKSTPRSQLFKSPPTKGVGSALYIRGEKFLVTGNGNRLQRAPESPKGGESSSPSSSIDQLRRRIDVGGVTFVANDKGTFERTNSHVVRSYLSHAKQKSLNTLKTQFKKNNVPCMIYRRLGKCLSHERGKCNKVHNPDQVAVCKNFLRGRCTKSDCLLSHRACMTKMPTCHFFLDGCCTTVDCPYLHKKVNRDADICTEFQKGFCSLADRCSKRHEFVKSVKMKSQGGNLEKRRLIRNRRIIAAETPKDSNGGDVATENKRYYGTEEKNNDVPGQFQMEVVDENSSDKEGENEADDESSAAIVPRRRPPIGTLPAFIPL